MNREEAAELIEQVKKHGPVMQAFAGGAVIECLLGSPAAWKVHSAPAFCVRNEYRVKPEPKYRPFTDNELKGLVGKVIVDGAGLTVLVDEYFTIGGTAYVRHYTSTYLAAGLLSDCKFPDGSPCGVLEDGTC